MGQLFTNFNFKNSFFPRNTECDGSRFYLNLICHKFVSIYCFLTDRFEIYIGLFCIQYFHVNIFFIARCQQSEQPPQNLALPLLPQDSERNPSYPVSYFYCNVVVVRSMHQNWSELPLGIPATAMPRGRILHLKDLLNCQRFYLYHSKNPFHFKTSAMNIMLYVVFGQRGD